MQYVILFFSIVNLLLGIIIWIHSKHERETVTFLSFAFLSSLWTFNNFYLRIHPDIISLRASYALGFVVATFGLIWTYFFLKKNLPIFVKYFMLPLTGAFFVVALFSDRIVRELYSVEPFGYEGVLGDWFIAYSLYFGLVILLILYNFFHQLVIEDDSARRSQIQYVLGGATVFAITSSIVSFVIPTFFNTLRYTIFDNFSFSIFLASIVYAILRFRLFNIRVLVTEIFVFLLWTLILIRATTSGDLRDAVLNVGLLVLSVLIGIFLIRSVLQEVKQREQIERLAKDLTDTNERQEKLIHFIGHEVKGYLTKGEYAFAELIDGDYGEINPDAKILATNALAEVRKGVSAVTDILKAANLKRGTVSYNKEKTDLKALLKEEIIKLRPSAEERGLALETSFNEEQKYMVRIDRTQFAEHVIRNLIDNSIKYTSKGKVMVRLAQAGSKVLLVIKDTGVGITDEDKEHLFTEGGHGKDSIKINVHSTGYGLYIAKEIVEAHDGSIKGESEGKGMGSTFTVELPAVTS